MSSSKSKIKKYFNSLKTPYASGSINKVWKFIRNKEKRTFHKIIQNLNKETCLDLGAGSGEYSKILLSAGAKFITCVDFSESLISEFKDDRIEKTIEDAETFNTNKKYNLILCLGLLEFLDKPKTFIIRLKGFLKPQGKLIILLPKSMIWSFSYALYYLWKGISIHPLSLNQINNFLIQEGFQLEQKVTQNVFSGFAVYSVKDYKKGLSPVVNC